MHVFRDTNGVAYAIRLWRVVIYTDFGKHPALRHGGIVTNLNKTRPVAQRIGWRFSFVRWSSPGANPCL